MSATPKGDTVNSLLRALPPMRRRDPNEPHHTATTLELFFDLVFVVAVSIASKNLHSFEQEGTFTVGIMGYLMVFAGIWWAWMNFTWFATAYGTDDWVYRVLTFVQMGGALTFAAGIEGIANPTEPNFTLGVTGYIIMRVAMILQWLRAALSDPVGRKTALAYAFGVAAVQIYWVLFLFFCPREWIIPLFWLGMLFEISVPFLAERIKPTEWHRHHLTERYGLFTIIVLGESILASTNSVIEAGQDPEIFGDLVLLSITGLTIVACMWWLYFALPQQDLIGDLRTSVRWGYGHYFIFASAAAVSSGIEIALNFETHTTGLAAAAAAATLCVPVAVFVFFVWLLIVRPLCSGPINLVLPLGALLIALASFAPYSLQVAAVLMIVLVIMVARKGTAMGAGAGAGQDGEKGAGRGAGQGAGKGGERPSAT